MVEPGIAECGECKWAVPATPMFPTTLGGASYAGASSYYAASGEFGGRLASVVSYDELSGAPAPTPAEGGVLAAHQPHAVERAPLPRSSLGGGSRAALCCSDCSSPILTGSLFCGNCGTKVKPGTGKQYQAAAGPPPARSAGAGLMAMYTPGTCMSCGHAVGPADASCSECRSPVPATPDMPYNLPGADGHGSYGYGSYGGGPGSYVGSYGGGGGVGGHVGSLMEEEEHGGGIGLGSGMHMGTPNPPMMPMCTPVDPGHLA